MNKQLLFCRFQPSRWASIPLWLYYRSPSFSGYRGLLCEYSPYKRCVEQETRHHILQIEHVGGVSEIVYSMIWHLTKTTRLEDDIHPPISECLTVRFYQHSTNYEPIKQSMCIISQAAKMTTYTVGENKSRVMHVYILGISEERSWAIGVQRRQGLNG